MLIDVLREATADHHRRTEAAFDLGRACASRERYATLLRTMLSMYRPIEARLAAVPGVGDVVDVAARRKSPLLERDLTALGTTTDVADEPTVASLPLDDASGAAGVLYVIEGSTLGGQFIRKHVARTLGLGVTDGCAFFAGYDDRTGRMWNEFVASVNRFGTRDDADQTTSCDAAIATFELFERALRAASG